MDINEIVLCIPNIVATLYESIYVFSAENNQSYHVQYTGDKLRVSSPTTIDELYKNIDIFIDNIKDEINSHEEFTKLMHTKVGTDKVVTLVDKEPYKLLFIMDVNLKKVENENKKILLIADDSPIITKFFTKTFQDEFEVLVAKDGNEAISLVNEYMDKPLVGAFFDLQMPNKNGFEVLEYFQENNLFGKIPVSVISGEDSADGISKATAYGIVDMLQKPFSADAARAIVNKTIGFSPKNK